MAASLATYITCDRCSKVKKCLDFYTTTGNPITVGFYRFYDKSNEPTIWCKFAKGMEEIICRECMWADEDYLTRYPHMRRQYIRDQIVKSGWQ